MQKYFLVPLGLIVPNDVKPGRWVRGINYITVKNDAESSAQP
jgi:hypothetical protein